MDIKAITVRSALDMLDMYLLNSGLDLAKSRLYKDESRLDLVTLQELIEKMASKLNQNLLFNSLLKIEIDELRYIQVVKIIDDKSKSKEVIRQIPSEKMLKIARYLDKITQLLLNKRRRYGQ